MKIASLIKQQRLAKGMSQLQLSKALGYSSSMTVSLIESGKMKVPMKAVPKLCKVLGISERKFMQEIIDSFQDKVSKQIDKGR